LAQVLGRLPDLRLDLVRDFHFPQLLNDACPERKTRRQVQFVDVGHLLRQEDNRELVQRLHPLREFRKAFLELLQRDAYLE